MMINDFSKNNSKIEIPDILNMSNYKLFNKNEDSIYELQSIVNHIGMITETLLYLFKRHIKSC